MWWPVAAIVYINLCAFTVQAWFQVLELLGIELPPEEVGVPCLFGFMLLLIIVTGYFKIYRPLQQLKKDCE